MSFKKFWTLSTNVGDESYPEPFDEVLLSLANKIFLMDYSTGIAGTFFGSSRDNNRISEE